MEDSERQDLIKRALEGLSPIECFNAVVIKTDDGEGNCLLNLGANGGYENTFYLPGREVDGIGAKYFGARIRYEEYSVGNYTIIHLEKLDQSSD